MVLTAIRVTYETDEKEGTEKVDLSVSVYSPNCED